MTTFGGDVGGEVGIRAREDLGGDIDNATPAAFLHAGNGGLCEQERADDEEETVRNRLAVYHRQTSPLINYYQSWAEANTEGAPVYNRVIGIGEVESIRDKIFTTLDEVNKS